MESESFSHHISRRFNAELEHLRSEVLRMGGLVQEQLERAVQALRDRDVELARDVIARDHVVNFMDVQADDDFVHQIQTAAEDINEVQNVETLWVRKSGLEYFADIHIEVELIFLLGLGQIKSHGALVDPPGGFNVRNASLKQPLGEETIQPLP